MSRLTEPLTARPALTLPRVAAASAAVVLALLLTSLLQPWLQHTRFVFFYGAVLIAAAVGGPGLGVAVMAVSIMLAEALFVPAAASPLALVFRIAAVSAVSLGAVGLVHRLQRASGEAQARRAEAERLTASLNEQAALLEQQAATAAESRAQGVRARVRAEFAERRLEFLAAASARLAASLEYQDSLAALAGMSVPDLADWCAVHLVDDGGTPRLVASAYFDRQQVVAGDTAGRHPGSAVLTPPADIIASGEPRHDPQITEQTLREAARDAEQLELLRSLGLVARLIVPISTDNGTCGTITLAMSESGRSFDEQDITLAAELGRRAGQAVQNARLYAVAHRASEAKSDFLAVMSHELRTPLNAIIGYSDLLLLGVPSEVPDKARRQIERIRSASNSLLQLVEEVLSFSRIEAGKEEIRISPVDLSALLRDSAELMEPLAAEKSLPLIVDVPDEPVKVVSDERKIRQIATNLLSNAVKFTESGSIRVGLEVTDTSVRIDFSDTGIGIPAEHLDHIFDPFWQVEQTATRRYGGTGLGLGVARKLATLLEGRLEVSSTVGQGSTFTLILPRHTPGTGRVA